MKCFSLFIVVMSLILLGCHKDVDGPHSAPDDESAYKPYNTSEFDVSIDLSKDAYNKLDDLRENIDVVVYFDGDSKEGPSERNAPFRAIFLGSSSARIELGETAHIYSVKYTKEKHDLLSNGIYFAVVNVASGGRALSSNILDCEVPEIQLGLATQKPYPPVHVQCLLIGERY